MRPGQGDGLLHLPAGVVREPDVAHLPGAHEVVEGAEGLLERGDRVPGVHLVEVDALDAEPPQRVVESTLQVPAGEAQVVDVAADREAALGGEHDPVTDLRRGLRQPAADDLLGRPCGVDVGRVDQVAAGLEEGVELLVRPRLVRLLAEGHRAEGQVGDGASAAPEGSVVHAATLPARDRGCQPGPAGISFV